MCRTFYRSILNPRHQGHIRVRRASILALLVSAVMGVSVGISPPPAQAAGLTVNSTADTRANDGECTLREAIIATNTDTASGAAAGECAAGSGADTIEFDIDASTDPGCNAKTGVCTIKPGSQLPIITADVTIDGYSQPDSNENTNPLISQGSNAVLKIELDGTTEEQLRPNGLEVRGGSSTIKGLVINGFRGNGIRLDTDGNTIEGNFIGTNVAGTAVLGNGVGFGSGGVLIMRAGGNTIGGTDPAARNVISGNDRGVFITSRAHGNMVQGNYIGTDVTGTVDLGNNLCGVRLGPGANFTTISGNVISGNNTYGVCIRWASLNEVKNNFIGTNATGILPLGNSYEGVLVNGSSSTIIAGNVISGNGGRGILIQASKNVGRNASRNVVQGNFIGTNSAGADLGNGLKGVEIIASPVGDPGANPSAVGNIIGGTGAGEGNTIAYNAGNGVVVDGHYATENSIRGNSIHDNAGEGISFLNGPNNRIKPPKVTAVSIGLVEGKACKLCEVDVFSDDIDEGETFEGTILADDRGNWSLVRAVTGPFVTATNTDASNNTSEYSAPFSGTSSVVPMGTVKGKVTDANTGKNLAGVLVKTDTDQSATTGKSGRYTIENVPVGDRLVTASKEDYAAETLPVTVTAGETATRNFALGQ